MMYYQMQKIVECPFLFRQIIFIETVELNINLLFVVTSLYSNNSTGCPTSIFAKVNAYISKNKAGR